MRSPHTRIRIDAALGRTGVALLALVVVAPDWIESLFGFAPDAGDGSVEWGIVLTLLVLMIVAFVLAGRTARRQANAAADRLAADPSRGSVASDRDSDAAQE